MRASLIITLTFLTFATGGCDKKDPGASQPTPRATASPAATQQPTPAYSGAAHASVKPGSHEDWCVEHAVPESLCTRCNASLTPGFKATGDWCAEHALPESQCLKCNPDLKIERPPKTAGK
jgi:hypothetical protein